MFKNNFFIPIRSGLVRFSRTYCLLVLNLNNKSRTCLALITKDKDNVSPSKQTIMRRLENYFSFIVYFMIILMASVNMSLAQAPDMENMHFVQIDIPQQGIIEVAPPLPMDGRLPDGTVLTIKATPAEGYVFDGGYYAIYGTWGKLYFESMTPEFEVVIDQDKTLGASFIEKKALEGFRVIQNVEYAQPGEKLLKYDVFTPEGAIGLPCIIIIHGGGWSINTEDIMRGLARELVSTGDYVVFSIDYRWISNLDGDQEPNQLVDIIQDVYGAICHIQEHAQEYGGDPGRIALTGDSAGGHLSAAAANFADRIGDGGFGGDDGVFEFNPSYLPEGKPVGEVRRDILNAIRAVAPSYGVFGGPLLKAFMGGASEEYFRAIAPIENIPDVKDRNIPQYLLRGTNDFLIQNESVQAYADALKAAGQKVIYEQVEGAGHAFFDWKPDSNTKEVFLQYGVPYAAKMKAFFDEVFYPKE